MSSATSSRTQHADLRRLVYIAGDDPRNDPAFDRSLRLAELAGAELSVAVTVDRAPSPTDGRRLLAHHVLSVGLMVAEMLGAEVDILHAWSVYGEVELRGGFARTSKDKVDKYVRQQKKRPPGRTAAGHTP